MKKKKISHKIIMTVSFLFLITVGFALISTSLNINGLTAFTRKTWKIYFDNVQVTEGSVAIPSGGTVPSVPTGSKTTTTLSWDVTFTEPGEFYDFTVDIVNDGTLDAMIDSVDLQPEFNELERKLIEYKATFVSTGAELAKNDAVKANSVMPIRIRIVYKRDIDNSDLGQIPTEGLSKNMSISINYVQANKNQNQIPELKAGAKMLVEKANPLSVTDYMSGNISEMYTFEQPTTQNLSARVDYRFIGDELCLYDDGNYWTGTKQQSGCYAMYKKTVYGQSVEYSVYCTEDNDTTCERFDGIRSTMNNYIYFNGNEMWRIIGVFDGKIKIIKDEKLSSHMEFDIKRRYVGSADSNYNAGSNDWTDSQLMLMLNQGNYTKSSYLRDGNLIYDDRNPRNLIYEVGKKPVSMETGATSYSGTEIAWKLNNTAWSQASEEKYYLGAATPSGQSTQDWYIAERSNRKPRSVNELSWTGKVGLMYPSDFAYTYAKNVNKKCYESPSTCGDGVWTTSWMFKNVEYSWTITPCIGEEQLLIYSLGNISRLAPYTQSAIYPVVYLKPEIELEGTGSKTDPYRIVES